MQFVWISDKQNPAHHILQGDWNRTENDTRKRSQVAKKLIENEEKLIEKASINGDRLTEKRIEILRLMIEDPYISKVDIWKTLELHPSSVWRNIEAMRGKYPRHIGSVKGGFWEIIV